MVSFAENHGSLRPQCGGRISGDAHGPSNLATRTVTVALNAIAPPGACPAATISARVISSLVQGI